MVAASHTNELSTPMCPNTASLAARDTDNASVASMHRPNHAAASTPAGRPINGVNGNTPGLPEDKYATPSKALKRIAL